MLVRSIDKVKTISWGNGLSRRFLLASDGLGYSLTDTTVRAGTKSPLQYLHHREACYCIHGTGWVHDRDGTKHRLEPAPLEFVVRWAHLAPDLRAVTVTEAANPRGRIDERPQWWIRSVS